MAGLTGCVNPAWSPTSPTITNFTANPTAVTAGGTASLTGVFANGTGVITPGNLPATSGTAVTVTPSQTTTYILTVTSASGGVAAQTATVTVSPAAPTITSFTATPTAVTAGGSASLTGVFANGTGVITPGNIAATSGTAVSVTPADTTTYTLTVTNTAGNTVTQAATVTVNPVVPVAPTITSFTATPASIAAGGTASLTGVFSGGTGVITPGNIAATSGTAVSVTPSDTTLYTLTVTNSAGVSVAQTATVTVNPSAPAIASFTANPASITAGASASLTGVFSGGTGVITPGNIAATSGTAVSVTPSDTTTYTLTVTNSAGVSVAQTATVAVNPAAPTITSFTANPASVTAGGTSSLTGVFANGTGVITPGNLAATSGTAVTVTPSDTTIYTLTVTNSAGVSVAQAVTVTVNPAAPTITSFTANPASITAGASASLTGVFSGGKGVITPGNIAATSGTAVSVTPSDTTIYTLTVTNSAGVTITQAVTVKVTATSVPAAPTGLTATAGNASVSLSWTASTGATSYNVYRGTTSGGESTTPIATGITTTAYSDTGLTNGTTYYYKVAAVNGGGTSGYSNEASATPELAAPAAPIDLTATAGNALVTLNWWAGSANATSYNVYRGTTSGGESATPIATGIIGLQYTDTGLTSNQTYYYEVAAVNSAGISAMSNEASATLTANPGKVAVIPNVPAYPFQVLPGSTRQINVQITGGTLNTINWSWQSTGTKAATASFTTPAASNASAVAAGLPTVQVNIGAATGNENCTINGSVGAYTITSPVQITVTAQSVDDPTASGTFLFNVCAKTTTVIVAPAYQQAFQGQHMTLQSWVSGDTDETGTWSIVSQPSGGNGVLADTANRDTDFVATVTGRYTLKYTSHSTATDSSTPSSATAIVYVSPNAMPSYASTPNKSAPHECYVDPALTGGDYEVGAGKAYTTISSTPSIDNLAPGTIIRIWNTDTTGSSPSTFHEYYQISSTGTPTQPIILCGVPDSLGNLPIVDGSNAKGQSDIDTNGAAAGAGIITAWKHDSPYGYWQDGSPGPNYVSITGLHIRNANVNYSYYPPGSTTLTPYGEFVGCVSLYSGTYIDVSGNELDNCGLGLFTMENASNGWNAVTQEITVMGNHIQYTGEAGDYSEHEAYFQAWYGLMQGNLLDNFTSGAEGGGIKWRGVEGIFRYNSLATGPSRDFDLVENQDGAPYVEFEDYLGAPGDTVCDDSLLCLGDTAGANIIAAYQESEQKDFIYGNLIFGTSAEVQIHYAADDSGGMQDRNGTLYFYSNTLDNAQIIFDNGQWGDGYDPFLQPRVDARNNILWARTVAWSGVVQMVFGHYATIIMDATTNLMQAGTFTIATPIEGAIWQDGTQEGWPSTCDSTPCFWPLTVPLNTHLYGLSNANYLTTSTLPYDATTLVPVAGSAAIEAGTPLSVAGAYDQASPGILATMPVRWQYSMATNSLTPRSDPLTVGAEDYSAAEGAPAAPTGLTATAGNATVALSWTASTDAASYNVYRGTTSGGESTTPIATGITTTAYSDTGLTNGTTYYYKVAAVNGGGTSGYSNEASATPELAAPAAPTGLTATAGNASVSLSWTASTGATSYNVYRGTTSGGESTTPIATGITTTAYSDTGLTNGTTYYYKVAAVNGGGTSGYSNEASATPSASAMYTLPPERTTLWQPGVTYNGGIPTNRTQCGATVTVSGDTSGATDTTNIQNAIDACPAEHFVLLGPGTFYITTPSGSNGGIYIQKSNITLRGSGAGVTTLTQTDVDATWSVIVAGFQWYHWPQDSGCGSATNCTDTTVGSVTATAGGLLPLTADTVKESNTATVATSSITGLSSPLVMGELFHISEQFDPNFTWYNPGQATPAGQCDTAPTWDSANSVGYCGWGEDWADTMLGASEDLVSRPIGQANMLTAITTNGATTTLTFAAPWHHAFRVSHAADLARISDTGQFYTGIGIENLTVANGGGGDGGGNIVYWELTDSWIKNVESYNSNGGAIHFVGCFRCELRDSYLHTAGNPNPGGGGYGMEIDAYTSDSLFENNISWSFNKVMVMRGAGGGNVIGYNYFEDGYGAGYGGCEYGSDIGSVDPQGGQPYTSTCSGIPEAGMNATHMTGTQYALFEGNQSFNIAADGTWGNATYITFFRNHAPSIRRNINNGTGTDTGDNTSGSDAPCSTFSCFGPVVQLADSMGRDAIGLTNHQWWYSYVGNVLGYPNNYLQSPAIGYAYPATFSAAPGSATWFYEWNGVYNGGAAPGQNPQEYWTSTLWILGNGDNNQPDAPSTLPGAGGQTVLNTLLRDGNFDYVTGKTLWMGSNNICNAPGDAACTATNTGNICTDQNLCAGHTTPPAVSTLPNSLYIPASMQPPPFFNGGVWPWVDGTKASNPLPGTLPARTRFDAGTPNIVPVSGTTPPAAPTGLTATAGNAIVALSWTASTDAASYNVYRGTTSGGESTTPIATGITTTAYSDTGLTNGTTYYYKVAAVSGGGTSPMSNEASATPEAPALGAPIGLVATGGNATVGLSWTPVTGATSYNVYRGTTSGGESATPIATGITITSYTDTGLTNGQPYYYEVAAVNASGTSPMSNEASATPELTAPGDPTSGVLPPYNDVYANWKNAGLALIGGIPNRTTICATVNPLGGGQDDYNNIQTAINNCPAGEVVQLAAGAFSIKIADEPIQIPTGISLRGTGTCNGASSPYCQTSITVMDGALAYTGGMCGTSTSNEVTCPNGGQPEILMAPVLPDYNYSWETCGNPGANLGTGCGATPLAADAAQGQTTIQVTSTSGFTVGSWVLIDEASDAGWVADPMNQWTGNGSMWAAPDWLSPSGSPATGRVLWAKAENNTLDFDSTQYPYQANSPGCWWSYCDRVTSELHKIASIGAGPCPGTNCTITFDDPLTVAFRESGDHDAQVYAKLYGSNSYFESPISFLQQAGVENISLLRAPEGGLEMELCVNCWVENTEVGDWIGGGISVEYSARSELNTVYVHHCWDSVNNGGEYPLDLANASTEMLITNSITNFGGKGMVARAGGAGSVVSYNYIDDQMYDAESGIGDYWLDMSINASHYPGPHHVLFEGNWGNNLDNDNTHGNSTYMTFFRNVGSGFRMPFTDPSIGKTVDDFTGTAYYCPSGLASCVPNAPGPLRAAGPMGYNYWFAYVGNVLGTSGESTAAHGWTYSGDFTGNRIFMLGWGAGGGGQDPYIDGVKASYIFINGNYDYLNNAVTWQGSPVTLPNSFYLPSEPAFFTAGSGYNWPWVTPTGSQQIQTGPSGCGGTCSGLPAQARWQAGKPFVQP
jgi:fibronectin type 3 domain-containing protein